MPTETPPRPPARRGRKPKPRLLELRITLADIEPPIWRRVRVPDAYTLEQLHRVIQLVFGWLDYHLYRFEVGERRFEELHDESAGEDPADITLAGLALGKNANLAYIYDFGDYWVHQIVVEDVYIINPFDEDDHRLHPMLYAGERAGPREDSGGPHGYREMRAALDDSRHPEHKHYKIWAEVYDPDRFDLWMARNNLTLAAAWGAI